MMGHKKTLMKDGHTMIVFTHSFAFNSRVQFLISAFLAVFLSLMTVLPGGGLSMVLLLLLIVLPVAWSWNASTSNFESISNSNHFNASIVTLFQDAHLNLVHLILLCGSVFIITMFLSGVCLPTVCSMGKGHQPTCKPKNHLQHCNKSKKNLRTYILQQIPAPTHCFRP